MEQVSDFNIDACQACGEFHRVAWYENEEKTDLILCDTCLSHYIFEENQKNSKVST